MNVEPLIFEPSFLESPWHPMTRRASSVSPCRVHVSGDFHDRFAFAIRQGLTDFARHVIDTQIEP